MNLTVIVTTIGRATLLRTLDSLQGQPWGPGDEVLLVNDGPASEQTRRVWTESGLPGRLIEIRGGPHHDWGATPRNQALRLIKTTHAYYLDDDDCLVPNAVGTIRAHATRNPSAMLMFQLRFLNGSVIWRDKFLVLGYIATSNFCFPTDLVPGEWGTQYEGDYQFIRQTVMCNTSRPVIWIPEIIALARHRAKPHDPLPMIHGLWVGDRLSAIERLSIASYLHNGHGFTLYSYNHIENVPDGVVSADAARVLPEDVVFLHTPTHFHRASYSAFSDCFRFKLLATQGGWWSDLDVVCLRPYEFDAPYCFPSEIDSDAPFFLHIPVDAQPTSCVVKAPGDSAAMRYGWEWCRVRMPVAASAPLGPDLVREIVPRFGLEQYVQPAAVFCPVEFRQWERYLRAGTDQCRLQHELAQSYAAHLWNEMWWQNGIAKDTTFPAASQVEIWKRHYVAYVAP